MATAIATPVAATVAIVAAVGCLCGVLCPRCWSDCCRKRCNGSAVVPRVPDTKVTVMVAAAVTSVMGATRAVAVAAAVYRWYGCHSGCCVCCCGGSYGGYGLCV
jgi:hypothetical protein